MNLPPKSDLTDAKYAEILALLGRLGIRLSDIEESFVRGSGHGGQKINKTNNAVRLIHVPTGTQVKYQEFRERSMNRILALRELLRKMDPKSMRISEAERIRKQKARRARRAKGQDPAEGG